MCKHARMHASMQRTCEAQTLFAQGLFAQGFQDQPMPCAGVPAPRRPALACGWGCGTGKPPRRCAPAARTAPRRASCRGTPCGPQRAAQHSLTKVLSACSRQRQHPPCCQPMPADCTLHKSTVNCCARTQPPPPPLCPIAMASTLVLSYAQHRQPAHLVGSSRPVMRPPRYQRPRSAATMCTAGCSSEVVP